MKKYPFSKKAVKAILAASIALSPFAGAGAVTTTNVAYAATYDSYDDLTDRLLEIYDELTADEKADLKDIRAELEALLNDEEFLKDAVAGIQIEKKNGDDATETQKINVAKSLVELGYATNRTELQSAKNNVLAKYAQDIKDVFGVQASEFIDYIASVEYHLFTELKGKDLNNMKTTDYQVALLNAMGDAADDHKDINDTVTAALLVNIDAVLALRSEVQQEVDVKQLKAILVNAFTRAQAPKDPDANPGTGSGGVGGGPSPTPTPDPKPGNVPTTPGDISSNPGKVADAIKNAKEFKNLEITLSNKAQDVTLPPTVLKAIIEKNKEATIDVKTDAGSYRLPASQINLAELAKELGGTADDVNIKITVKVGKDDKDVIGKNKLTAVSNVVEFTVEVEVKGSKKELKKFTSYVDRTIKGNKEFDADKSVALRLEEDGGFTALPTYFDEDQANVKSMTNSQYVVVENNKTFNDLSTTWNKAQIEKLANKYIVQGQADGSFGPYASTTRVQLAVLLTRALGLSNDAAYDSRFKDVKGNEWFVPEVTAAVNAGIIQGKVDGSFDPYAPVSRAQAALMINRALEFVSYDKEAELDKTLKVESFKDESKILDWARKDIETLLQAGIMQGLPNGNFDPYAETSRSQMVKILDEALKTLKFINE